MSKTTIESIPKTTKITTSVHEVQFFLDNISIILSNFSPICPLYLNSTSWLFFLYSLFSISFTTGRFSSLYFHVSSGMGPDNKEPRNGGSIIEPSNWSDIGGATVDSDSVSFAFKLNFSVNTGFDSSLYFLHS